MVQGYKRKSHEHRKDIGGEYKWGDAGQLLFLIIFIVGMISDLFLLKISDKWQYILPWYFRIVIFLLLLFIAGRFVQKAHKKVFKEERKELKVINTGIFAKIRHPMYFGLILLYLDFIILSLSIIAFVIFIMVFVFYYYLCRYEEQILIEILGDDYKKYIKNVHMFIPKIKR